MIAILGATGTIGRSLANHIAGTSSEALTLFARAPARLAGQHWPRDLQLAELDAFDGGDFSLVINAIGAGDPGRVAQLGATLFETTRYWDERVLSTLEAATQYVFLSSGAVYGQGDQIAGEDGALSVAVNRMHDLAPYTASKLFCELRHRYLPERAILDLRVFGYATGPLQTEGSGFLSSLAQALATHGRLQTSRTDMIRDYAGVQELWALISAWRTSGAPNRALDLYTLAPVAKHALLAEVQALYGLEIAYVDDGRFSAPTGAKPIYASEFRAAGSLGYAPTRDALTVVLDALSTTLGAPAAAPG